MTGCQNLNLFLSGSPSHIEFGIPPLAMKGTRIVVLLIVGGLHENGQLPLYRKKVLSRSNNTVKHLIFART